MCWLWLAGTLGAGSQRAGAVLDAFGGAQEAWEARDTDAFAAAAGPAAVQRACLPDNTPEHYRAFARRCAARRIRILPYDDPDYPLAFSRISDMPLVLYCTGDPRWLNEPAAVGMVGTRKPTEYGLRAAEDIGRGLARAGAVIVSGLADGLDSAGHRAAVGENCPTIAVMGVPIDRTYPAANRELRRAIERRGCVISEYPPESEPVGAVGFLQRNRLIAALSGALVVVEAKEKSGTMSTVGHAERYGKPVFAVPGSIFSPASAGTNALLRDGRAKAVCTAADLFGTLGLQTARPAPAPRETPRPLSENERLVLSCLGAKAQGVEELGVKSGLPTAALLGVLMKLELAGRVSCLPGKRYILRGGSAS
nr:DNA-processing protein DprA [Faecalibacterium sp. Marseille-P9590]